jgi:hypothetical protein
MNAGLTESQEILLDNVARTSRKVFLRRMMIGANRKENADEIRRIEDL